MTDIVERLREEVRLWGRVQGDEFRRSWLLVEAADEIERLRRLYKDAAMRSDTHLVEVQRLRAEIYGLNVEADSVD